MTRMPLLACMLLLTCLTVPTAASARCGSGNPPNYADIEAVMLAQDGHGGSIGSLTATAEPWQLRKRFEDSAYWVLFWETGPAKFPTEYSQFNLKGSVGTFHLSATLGEARAILRKDDFFALSPPGGYITDTAQAVLSVQRCAVVTRIRIFTGAGNSEPTAGKLFADLASMVKLSAKTRISTTPKIFDKRGIFDPLAL